MTSRVWNAGGSEPAYRPEARVRIYVPNGQGVAVELVAAP